MAPEALTYNRISKKSDIWSYGILLWEIWSHGCSPYPSVPVEQILKKLQVGYRMEKPDLCDDYIYENIMLSCWLLDYKKRPTFRQILNSYRDYVTKSGTRAVSKELAELVRQDEESTIYVNDIVKHTGSTISLTQPKSNNTL